MKNKTMWGLSSVLLVGVMLIMGACAPAATTAPITPTAPAQQETVKIGINCGQNYVQGLDMLKMLGVEEDKFAKDGGLDIGGKKVQIKFIYDDNKMDTALVKTVAQKHIFQDGCKFIISDDFAMPLYEMCDTNKVVGVFTASDDDLFNPKHEWVWGAGAGYSTFPGTIGWAAKIFPNLKTYQGVFPDRRDGHIAAQVFVRFAKAAGLTPFEDLYYPATSTDLSAIGTKVLTMNPDFLVAFQGGPALDAAVMKAAHSAGWKKQLIGAATMPGSLLLGIAGAEGVEGLVGLGWPAEFDPATTAEGKEFKAAYTAKLGKWDDPEIVTSVTWFTLKGAFQQAGSTDPVKVKAMLDGGMKPVLSPHGTIIRMPRPDMNNPKLVSVCIGNLPTKQIKGGQIKYFDTITVDQAIQIHQAAYGK
jgi:branched-chain amino acid transport system substrate-binding protein